MEIFLNRVAWNNPEEWTEEPVAKATYVKSTGIWKIYWQRADLKWHRYDPLPETGNFEEFLIEVEEDPCCCFWG